MKSEIAWLMEAFLEEDAKKVRVMIKDRMAEVTDSLTAPVAYRTSGYLTTTPNAQLENATISISAQSPSMQRIMQSNPDLIPKVAPPVTPAAAQALAARQALIMGAGKDKPDEGRKSPRKM